MFIKPYKEIITPHMAINVEAEVNEAIEEDAFLKHFYISTELVRGVKTEAYNPLCAKGFTIIVKEFNGSYSYQVSVQKPHEKRSFSRLIGRYYAYLNAKTQGFIAVPPMVTSTEKDARNRHEQRHPHGR